ncbi:MAG: hypothetical protein K5705_12495 [Oscillospiraceae bacterium]|nr:hypothetical protein [Oscillospiraceae bacterium]
MAQQIDLQHIRPLAEELAALEWFSHCAEKPLPEYAFPAKYCARSTAAAKIHGIAWENIRLQAVNEMTASLCIHHRTMYDSTYNSVVAAIKESFMQSIEKRVLPAAEVHFGKDAAKIWQEIRWDTLHMLLGKHFEACFHMPLYDKLLAVYRSGHIPVGMTGAYPDGTLLVH